MTGRIVIAGGGGQVGSVLAAEAIRRGRDVLALTSSQWDITDPQLAGEIVQAGDVLVNCAAYTAVDDAEADQVRAHAVNAVGPGYLAQACARAGARMVHVSTDYVFSGDFGEAAPRPYEPGDETRALSVYGQTKLSGEQAVLAALPQAVVVDQTGSPTYVADLVGALLEVVDGRVDAPAGIVHAANGGEVTRCGQARAVFAGVGADPERVRPVSSDHNPRPAARPPYSALSARRSQAAGLSPLRPWREALEAALAAAPGAAVPPRPLPSTRE